MALTPEQARANTLADLDAVILAAQTAKSILTGADSMDSIQAREDELEQNAKTIEAGGCRFRRNFARGLIFPRTR